MRHKELEELWGSNIEKPEVCSSCGGSLEYKGLGEYTCKGCGCVIFDDYGKVRNYLETHHGATLARTSAATGIGTNIIRQMINNDRLSVVYQDKFLDV